MDLTEARAAALAPLRDLTDWPVHDALPTPFQPGCFVARPADPWITGRLEFASPGVSHWEIQAIATGTDLATGPLEAMILDAATVLDIDAISAPFWGQVGDHTYPTCTITITIPL